MRFPVSILVFAAATSFSAAVGSAATLTWPGAAPCGTGLQACINAAAAGDIVLIQTNSPINEDLTIDKSLTLKAQVGFTPRLGPLHFIFLSNPSPRNNVIVLEDFRCDRARIFAVQSSTGSFDVSMRRLNVENTYNDGPAIQIRTGQAPPYGPVVFDLSNNQVTIPAGSQFNGAQAISIEGGDAASMTGVVRGNVINHLHGGQSGAIGLYNLNANPFDVDVIANRITGSNYNDGILFFQFGTGTSLLRYLDNLVVGQVNVAGAPGAYVVNVSEGDATFEIVNNTTTAGGIGILVNGRDDLGASWSGTVANNIVSDMTGGGIQIGQPTQTSGTVDNDHNLVYDVAFNDFTPGPGTLFVDPLFLGVGDYHLSSPSPAVNSGNPARVPADLATDLDGLARQVGTVDMGAYEMSAYETACLTDSTTWPVCGVPMATKPGPQLNACLIADGAGGAFLSYTHLDSISSPNPNIWLNHVDANGDQAPGWPVDGFPMTALPGQRGTSRTVLDGSGGAFVAWQDRRNDPGGDFFEDIYLQHITSSGSPAPGWPVNGLAVHPITPSADEFLTNLVSDGAGGVFLLWSGSGGMVLNRITGSGTVHPNWPPSGTVVTTAAAQLIADGAGGVYVCWSISTPTPSLRLTRLTGLGAYASGWPSAGVIVTTLSSTGFALDLGRDGSHVNLAWTMSTGEIRASRVMSSGSIAPGWSAFGVSVRSTTDPKSSLMVTHGGTSGDGVVVWREDLPAPDGFQLVAQRLTPTGAVAAGWPATGWVVVPNFAQNSNQVRAFPDCNNGTALAWISSGIRALRFTPSATVAPGWPASGVLLCGGTYSTVTPNVSWACPDGTGGVITGIPRAPAGSGNVFNRVDIYAQCVRGDGTVDEGFGGGTPVGSNVVVTLGPVTVTFPTVTSAGQTFLELADSGPPPPFGLQIVPTSAPVYYDVTTTAQYQSPVQIRITYDPATLQGPENALQLLHFDATLQPPDWVNVTTTIDVSANTIYGSTPTLSPFIIAEADPTDVADGLPRVYRLFANIPNPFNPTTTIHYELPTAGHVKVDVLDVRGRLVRTLVDGHVEAGRRFAVWDGRDGGDLRVASGVYLYRLRAGTFVETRRMVLLK